MHVFTYGTLMFPEVWQAVVGRSFTTIRGVVRGFAIYRVCDAVYPGIIASDATCVVEGLVYLDVDAASIAKLDAFESDFYERRTIAVACADGCELPADCYVVPHAARHALTAEPWSAAEFVARGDLQRFTDKYAGFDRVASDSP
jgi:gamma-glutamylcyclotransferase (GGCT)/AIG2-like uncharacterized protein YtfP